MSMLEHLDKNNLHHAYLLEGKKDEILPEILKYIESIGIKTLGNPDFCNITIDSMKIDDAFSLREMSNQKAFSGGKKIFVVSANNFTLDAQGVLLKMFEEPIADTHFFLIVPESAALLKTVISRFYLIKNKNDSLEKKENIEKFLQMSLAERISFLKELLTEAEEEFEEENEVQRDSNRSKALKFLNELETVLNQKIFSTKEVPAVDFLNHILKVREYLRQPGSSIKTLLESVALVVPVSKKA